MSCRNIGVLSIFRDTDVEGPIDENTSSLKSSL